MKGLSKLISTFIGGLVITAMVVFFAINPLLDKVSNINKGVVEKKTELVTLEQQIIAYQNAKSDLAKAARKQDIFDAFVAREDLVKSVISLEAAALKSGGSHILDIIEEDADTKPKSKKEETRPVISGVKNIGEVPFRISFTASFVGTVDFLKYLEHLPQFAEVTQIDMSAEFVESSIGELTAKTGNVLSTIDGVFFVKKDSEK